MVVRFLAEMHLIEERYYSRNAFEISSQAFD